jgi:hypothetical protein
VASRRWPWPPCRCRAPAAVDRIEVVQAVPELLNSTRIDSAEALRARIVADLSACAGAPVEVEFGLPGLRETPLGESIDGLDLEIDCYGPPQRDSRR